MKFIIAVVMLAVTVSVNCHGPVLEVSHWGGHQPGPVVDSHWGGSWGGDASGNWDGAWGNGGSSGSPHGAPHIHLSQGHGGPVADHGHHGHDGKYVAANRGSVHVAPLVGHVQSVSSKNLEPAPGTTW